MNYYILGAAIVVVLVILILIYFLVFRKDKKNDNNKKFSAPNFSIRYKNPQNGNYTGWTGKISSDGNTITWTSFDKKQNGTWIRASSLKKDQDPTIIDGGEISMTNLPAGYSNNPETNIKSYNWLNLNAKWPVLISSSNVLNTYYMKQGTHYNPDVDVLITS